MPEIAAAATRSPWRDVGWRSDRFRFASDFQPDDLCFIDRDEGRTDGFWLDSIGPDLSLAPERGPADRR
jgi:hypothetical protein